MRKNFKEIANYFVITGFLKVYPYYQVEITNSLYQLLEMLKTKDSDFLTMSIGPLFVFGQYDILFIIGTSDLARGNRLFYTIIEYLNNLYPESIRDFYKTIGFEWLNDTNTEDKLNNLAYANLKFKYPAIRTLKNELLTETIQRTITNYIKDNDLGLFLRIFGSFSWNELTFLLRGSSYESIFKLSEVMNKNKLIADSTVILLRDIASPSIKLPKLPRNSVLLTQLYFHNDASANLFLGTLRSRKLSVHDILKSFQHTIIRFDIKDVESIDSFWALLYTCQGIEYSKTTLYSPIDKRSDLCKVAKPKEHKIRDTIVSQYDKFTQILDEIESASVSKRKLLALRTQLKILSNITQFRYILPDNIIKSIDYLLNETSDISEETIQYYISEYTAAVNERIAGAQLDAIIGKDIGFLERHASYQRLVLSCESLILKCYMLYIEKVLELDVDFANRPILFIFFDYGARMSNEIPSEIISQGVRENMPIILRLKMLKYKPWLWITGLRELSKLIYYLKEGMPPLDIFADESKLTSFSDNFICHFITKDNFKKLLKEELGYFEEKSFNTYNIYPEREEEIERRLDSIDFTGRFLRNSYIKDSEIEKYMNKLLTGELVFQMDDVMFFNFVNAYYSLDRIQQRSAKPLISFTLSLYWNHKSQIGGG
jgi:hypothetical protein